MSDYSHSEMSMGEILLKYWFLPTFLGLFFAAAGVVAGLSRTPQYTASSVLSVGTTSVNTSSALGGFAASAPTLAGAYARAVGASEVIGPVARKLHLSPESVLSRVVASQVPETPIIRIDATAPSSHEAIELANQSANRLRQYVGSQKASLASGKAILRRYQAAQEKLTEIESESGVSSADIASAKLRTNSLARAYQHSQEGLGVSNPLAVLSLATTATSDKKSKIELLAVSGLLAGIVLGSAIALLVGRRRYG